MPFLPLSKWGRYIPVFQSVCSTCNYPVFPDIFVQFSELQKKHSWEENE